VPVRGHDCSGAAPETVSFSVRTYIRERRPLLISIHRSGQTRNESAKVRVSIAADLARRLSWNLGQRLDIRIGRGLHHGWIEILPGEAVRLRGASRGSRFIVEIANNATWPDRFRAREPKYRAAQRRLLIKLPWPVPPES
jgi:hypothetical protein